MKNIKMRALALLMAIVMVFGIMPTHAFATEDTTPADDSSSVETPVEETPVEETPDEETPEEEPSTEDEIGTIAETTNVAKVGSTEYATIDEAIANWTTGTTLTLLADVTLSDVIQLSSTEHHILDLGTYTMTAASKKDAIQIVNNGRSSASYALDIKADATNPGGITASGKAVVKTTGKTGVKDRPIIRFYGGVFTGTNVVYHSGSNGTNCPQFWFYGGTFNGTVYANRAKFIFYGGTFNGSLQMSVDSSADALIVGGTFKQLSNQYGSSLNTDKFTIGSAAGVYDREVYVDDNGYYVVAAAEPAQGIEASVPKTPGTNDYLAYSKVKTEGKLKYTDAKMALEKNNSTSAKVTVYADTLDMTGINFKGTIVAPEGQTLKITNAPEGLKTEGNVVIVKPVAQIGNEPYMTLEAAIADAQDGATVTILADLSDLALVIDKSLTITSAANVELTNVSINGTAGKLTVSNLTFAGNSWINAGGCDKLVVENVIANVTPSNGSYTNSRSAFIGLGRNEGKQLDLTVTNCNIVVPSGTDAILGWAAVNKVTISGNTFGSETSYQNGGDIVKFMAIADGAVFNITGNTSYSNYNGFVFAQNTTRGNAYTVSASGNTFYGKADHIWIEISGANTCHATVNVSSTNTVNGNAFTAADIKAQTGVIKNWSSYAGVDVTTDANGKVTGGILAFYAEDAIAAGYIVQENADGGYSVVADLAYGKVAKIGDTYYTTLAEAFAAAQTGDEIVLLADVAEDITVPAGVIFNGNGKQVGAITAAGEITFKGHTKATNFGVQYVNTTINIIEGACLEITGSGRLVVGHGCTFNITGTITDAKTADKTTIQPSLIMPGASFTGAGVTFNVTNAYIKAPSSYCSSSNSASGTFDFNIVNSIWESAGKLAFEAQSTAATVNFELKDSVLTTGSHLVFGVSKGEIVIDNSNVNVGKSYQIENRSNMTIKNGSVVNGAVATSSNAINPGTIIVDNATYAVTGQFSGAAEGTGTLIIKNGASVSVGSIVDKANIVIDASGMSAGDEISFTGNLSKFAGTLEVINNDALEAKIVDGKIVLAVKPVASINGVTYATFDAAFAAAKAGDTITLLADITRTAPITITKSLTIDGGNHTLTYTGTDRAIDVPNTANGANVTIKNLKVDAAKANRGLNYNTTGEFTVENVVVTIGANVDGYAINFPGSADGAKVTITNSALTSRIPLNIWGENMVINVVDSEITSVDNSSTYFYSAIQLNKDTYGNAAEGTVVNVTGGKITALSEKGEPSFAVTNWAETAIVNISNTTEVNGTVQEIVAWIGGAGFPTLQAAVNSEYTGTIEILRDFAISESVNIPEGKKITIDLNGKTITGTDNSTGSFGLINLAPGAELTINDTVGSGKITLTATNNRGWGGYSSVISVQRAKLTVNGGTLEHLGGTDMAYAIDILTNTGAGDAEAVINGGIIKSTYRAIRQFANSTKAKTTLTVNGGTIEGANKSIWMQNANTSNNPAKLSVNASAAIKGDVLVSGSNASEWALELSVNDAALQGESTVVGSKLPATMVVENANGVWGIASAVAAVNGVGYATLAEAFAAAQDGDTITVLADIATSEGITNTKKITLDLNGKTISQSKACTESYEMILNKGSLTITGNGTIRFTDTSAGDPSFGWGSYTIRNEGTLVVENGTIEHKGAQAFATHMICAIFQYSGSTTINGGTISTPNYRSIRLWKGEMTINGGTFDGQVWVQAVDNSAKLTVNGGTFEPNGGDASSVFVSNATYDVEFAVTNGTFNGKVGANNATKLAGAITGGFFTEAAKNGTNEALIEGYVFKDEPNEDGYYTLREAHYVAKVNGVKYESLAEAVEAAKAGDTVTLLADVTVDSTVKITKSITLDGNNHKISGTASPLLSLNSTSNITVQNAVLETTGNVVRWNYVSEGYTHKYLNCQISGGVYGIHYDGSANGEVVIEGCTLDGFNTFAGSLKQVTVKDTIFDANQSGYAGANFFGHAVLENVTLVDDGKTTWLDVKSTAKVTGGKVVKDGNELSLESYLDADAKIGSTYYNTLTDALSAAQAGETVTLIRDVTTAATITINKDITINGNGNTITSPATRVFRITTGNVQVTMNDLNIVSTAVRAGSVDSIRGISIDGGFTDIELTLNNCTVDFTDATATDFSYAINVVSGSGHTLTVNGGSYEAANVINLWGNDHQIDVDGAVLTSIYGINEQYHGAIVRVEGQIAKLELTNNTFNGDHAKVVSYAENASCGNLIDKNNIDNTKRYVVKVGNTYYHSLAEAIAAAQNGETIKLLASIKLTEGVVVPAGKTITLDLNGRTVSMETADNAKYALILNKGNLTITGDGKLSYKYTGTNSSDAYNTIETAPGSVLTVKGGTIENLSENCLIAYAIDGLTNGNSGDVTVNIEGGKISSKKIAVRIFANSTTNTGNLNISGGEISGRVIIQNASAKANKAALNITGGIFNANAYKTDVLYVGGSLSATIDITASVSGGTFKGEITDTSVTGFITGGTFVEAVKEAYCAEGYIPTENTDGTYGVKLGKFVARIDGVGYETLADAIADAQEGDVIELMAGTIEEGAIKLPATWKNITIKGAAGKNSILKDMKIMSADGNSVSYMGITIDGVVFENSNIVMTGWRNNGATYKDWTITNCEFKNINNTTSEAAVHFNVAAHEAVENFIFTNNIIDGALGGSKSGLYLQATGNVVVKNNVINNVAFRPYVIQLTTDDGIADNFTVTGNTFSGTAAGRAQGLGNNAAGTDSVTLVVTGNIFKDITTSQQICYWNFNPETTTADLSKNYYDIDILANPNKIYFNSAAQDAEDLIEMGVYPYYADEAMTELVTAPAIMVTYPDGKIEYYNDMLEAVPYTTNCPRLEGAIIKLLSDIEAPGIRLMENGMILDLNGHTYTIITGTGSQGTNTSGFQIRPEVTTFAKIMNGTIKVAAGAPVVWMFNSYAADFIVEDVTVDCTDMAWGYGNNCYVVVSRAGDNVQFTGNTSIVNFNDAVAGTAINVGGTMAIGENVTGYGTIELDAGAKLTAKAGLDVITVADYKVVYADGVYTSVAKVYVAEFNGVKYESVAEALEVAMNAGLTDVVITLLDANSKADAIALEDSFYLYAQTKFDKVTFKQADPSKVYYIDSIYTGSRTNGGEFVFDGVNIVVTGQYIFEGNVVLTNNSIIKSVAEANCFIYNGETTIEPGSVLQGVIEDFRGGDMIIDGGKTDGSYNTAPNFQDAIIIINWSGDKLVLKNGAYAKINSANEIGRMTINAGTAVEIYASKLETVEYVSVNGTLHMDLKSLVTTKKITGNGQIVIDATGFNGNAIQLINADMSGFNGTIQVVGAPAIAEITSTGLSVKQGVVVMNGAYFASLTEALDAAVAGDTITFLADLTEDVTINKSVTIDGADKTFTGQMILDNKANITIKNVNFNGTDPKQYVIKSNGAYYITIENCTAKNAYGFVQVSSAAVQFTAKNVTVSDMNYGIKIDRCDVVALENLNIQASEAAFLNSNYGEKTVTIKNSKLNILGTWTRNNTIKTTYVFEGANTVSEFIIDAAIDNFKLAEDATLTAPNDITVTTDVDKMKVEYDNGTYKLVKAAIAKIGKVEYTSLQEAVDAAKAGQTITLVCDAEGPGVVINKNVTIDFGGFTYSVTEPVGSTGTESNGFQILKGNTVKLINGKLEVHKDAANKFYILIQNYANLTVQSMTLDGTNLDKYAFSDGDSYTLSNNSGNVNVNKSTVIANDDGEFAFAFDVCDQTSMGYSLPKVIIYASSVIEGNIEAVAKSGNTYYATLQQAVDAVNAGSNIYLVRDSSGAGVVIDKNVNIDFKGFTYTLTSGVGSNGTETNGFQILKGNTVSLKNGTLKVADSAADKFYILIQNYADLTVNNMTLDGTNLDKYAFSDRDSYTLSNNSGNVTIGANTKIIANNDGELAFAFDACDKSDWGYELPVVTVNAKATIEGNIEAAAKIGNVYYATLHQAIDAAADGKTITLMSDIKVDWNDVIMTADNLPVLFKVEGKSLTLDMNGKTISVDHQSTTDRIYAVIYVEADASLKVTGNGGIDVTTDAGTPKVAYMFWKRGTEGTLVIENGTYHMNNSEDSMVYTNGDQIVSVKGGTWTLDAVGTRVNRFPCIFNAAGNNSRGILVSGGTYNDNVAKQHWIYEVDIVDENGNLGLIKDNGNGTWTVGGTAEVGIVNQISGYTRLTGYATFKDAVASIAKGAPETTIRLMKNITVKGQFIGHSYAQNVVIDLNGYTMSSTDKTLTVYRSGTVVTIMNGTVTGNTSGGTIQVTYGGKLILGENVTVKSGGQATALKVDANSTLIIDQDTTYVLGGKNDLVVANGATVQISNGNFKKPVNATWCAEGYIPTEKLDNGYYSVIHGGAARIGDTYYDTLGEAVANAQTGETVTLMKDIDLANETLAPLDNAYNTYFKVEGKSITIDLNGKTISGKYIADNMLVGVFSTENNGHLVLKGNGTVNVTAVGTVYSLIANYEPGCSIVIENGTYALDVAKDSLIYSGVTANEGDLSTNGGIIVKGGNFTLGNVGSGANGSPWIFNVLGRNSGHIWVTGGTFNADVFTQHWGAEVQHPDNVTISANGNGTYTVR